MWNSFRIRQPKHLIKVSNLRRWNKQKRNVNYSRCTFVNLLYASINFRKNSKNCRTLNAYRLQQYCFYKQTYSGQLRCSKVHETLSSQFCLGSFTLNLFSLACLAVNLPFAVILWKEKRDVSGISWISIFRSLHYWITG